MPDIRVRTARLSEAGLILQLVRESMASYCRDSGIPDSYIEATSESIEVVEEAISSGVVFVAVDDEEGILGTCRLYIRPRRDFAKAIPQLAKITPRIAYFARFSVWDKWRSQGIGNFLFSYCEDLATRSGCSHMLLHTALSNTGMVKYYQSRGFSLLSSDQGRGYDRGLFAKRL